MNRRKLFVTSQINEWLATVENLHYDSTFYWKIKMRGVSGSMNDPPRSTLAEQIPYVTYVKEKQKHFQFN